MLRNTAVCWVTLLPIFAMMYRETSRGIEHSPAITPFHCTALTDLPIDSHYANTLWYNDCINLRNLPFRSIATLKADFHHGWLKNLASLVPRTFRPKRYNMLMSSQL